MRIAITGGIADGKSTVCGMLAEMGYPVVSADEIVRELHEDPEILERIRREVGTEFVNESGLDKPALRAAIGRDGSLRQKLNGIFHVPTMRKLVERTETDGIAFAEVPLLIETATQGWFDEVWVVEAGRDEQLWRLAERLGDEAAAVSMLATQLPTGAKIPFADRIVRTNEALDAVRLTIARHVRDLVRGSVRTRKRCAILAPLQIPIVRQGIVSEMLLRETERILQQSAVVSGAMRLNSGVQTRAGLLPFAFPGESIKPMRYKEDLSL